MNVDIPWRRWTFGRDRRAPQVTLVGVVRSKRQMAKRLCFVTLAPPEGDRWRPIGRLALWPSVAVQAILGKTLERNRGADGAANAIRRLKVGETVALTGAPTFERNLLKKWRQLLFRRQLDLRCADVRLRAETELRVEPFLDVGAAARPSGLISTGHDVATPRGQEARGAAAAAARIRGPAPADAAAGRDDRALRYP